MKLSEFIADLQEVLDAYGDRELLQMPAPWLQDFLPDEVARWLLLNGHCNATLLPDGVIAPALLDQDLEDSEIPAVAQRLEDAAAQLARDPVDRMRILSALQRSIDVVKAFGTDEK